MAIPGLINLVPIIPARLWDTTKLIRVVDKTLVELANGIKMDFEATTRTWQHRPEFIIDPTGQRGVYTGDPIYRFITRGTSIRYATMTPNFQPKSRRRVIGSSPGAGGLAYVSRRIPRPGIQAREWEEAIRDKWRSKFPVLIQRAIDGEVKLIP